MNRRAWGNVVNDVEEGTRVVDCAGRNVDQTYADSATLGSVGSLIHSCGRAGELGNRKGDGDQGDDRRHASGQALTQRSA